MLVVGGLLLVLVVVVVLPVGIAVMEGFHGSSKAEEADRIRTALIALGGGALATLGAYNAYHTFELSRSGQVTDRFAKAIGQLGDANPRVRLGGIYALERIAHDSRRDHPQVMELLTAYVREQAPWSPEAPTGTADGQERTPSNARSSASRGERLANDVQAVLAVLGRRQLAYDIRLLDLSGTDLRGAKLAGAKLQRAIIVGANLDDVDLHLDEAEPSREFDHLDRGPLLDARFDATTKLPKGVTRERAKELGARMAERNAGA